MDDLNIIFVDDAEEKSRICDDIIHTLPDWFGLPEANENYIRNMRKKDVFVAYAGERPVGLIALKYHFQTTTEIWWMGILPDYHRHGIGTALFEAAKQHTIGNKHQNMIVNTLSDRSDDKHYARTRAFYLRMGFEPLLEDNEEDPVNPMMWMIHPLP